MALEDDFRMEGYEVEVASDGLDGLAKATYPEVDLIILDIMLPGIDGLEICRMLKQKSSTAAVPIIMLTAKASEADVVVGLELGADETRTRSLENN